MHVKSQCHIERDTFNLILYKKNIACANIAKFAIFA